jgi:hypothetical protein
MHADGVEEVWVWRGENPRKMLGVPCSRMCFCSHMCPLTGRALLSHVPAYSNRAQAYSRSVSAEMGSGGRCG